MEGGKKMKLHKHNLKRNKICLCGKHNADVAICCCSIA